MNSSWATRSRESLIEQYEGVDERMKSAVRWLLATPDKIPHYVDGTPRRGKLDTTLDVDQLATFNDALLALAADTAHRFSHLGFALGADLTGSHWQGVDLDKIDTRPGLRVIAEDLPGYTERSPSGRGLHAIGYGREFKSLGNNGAGIEAYCRGRFFTVTGDSSGGTVRCIADHVERVLAPLRAPLMSTASTSPTSACHPASPETIVDLRSALDHLRADDRDLWIRMGMALKELGDTGRGLWLTWSQTSKKYDAVNASSTWDSLEPTQTSYEAVFAEAQRQGWVNPKSRLTGSVPAVQASPATDAVDLEAHIVDMREPVDPDSNHPCVVDCIVPQGEVTLLAGHGGTGKSFIALKLAIHVALGLPFGPLAVRQSRVCFYSAEDDAAEVQRRVVRICRTMRVPPFSLHERLFVLDVSELDPTLYRGDAHGGSVMPLVDGLRTFVRRHDIGLVIVDNASDTFAGNEIVRTQVRTFVRALRSVARPDSAVLLLAHVAKASLTNRRSGSDSSEDYSGSTAWHNSARSRLSLDIGSGGSLVLRHAKANRSAKAEPLHLDWHESVPVNAGEMSPAAEAVRSLRADKEAREDAASGDWLVQAVGDFERRGEYLTTATTSGSSLYNKIKGEPGFPKGLTSDRCNILARRLERAGRIVRIVVSKNRKSREVFALAPEHTPDAPTLLPTATNETTYRAVRDAA